jgi:hypothetical protein
MARCEALMGVRANKENAMRTIAEFDKARQSARPPDQSPAASPLPTGERERQDTARLRLAPGVEMHPRVYATVLISTIVFILSSWFAFGKDGETDYVLLIVALIFGVFTALPILIYLAGRRSARAGGADEHETLEFLDSRVETGSGPLTGRQAWVQIAIIPLCLALAAILIGLASSFST